MTASESIDKRAQDYRATASRRRGQLALAVEEDRTRARWLRISWIGFMVAAASIPYLINKVTRVRCGSPAWRRVSLH